MDFYSVRELRNSTKDIFKDVQEKGEAVITSNGKPTVLMLNIGEGDYESIMAAVRQARAMIAFNEIRTSAEKNGYMSKEEIEKEIEATRKERRASQE